MSKQKFDYSFLYLLGLEDQCSSTEDAVVYLDTLLDLLRMISPISEERSGDYSNHLNINSAWKSLLASCVCVCGAKVFISSV